MFVSDCLKINNKNYLEIGGCDVVELAKEYDTPLYIMDENAILSNCNKFISSINKFYDGYGMVLYASKAFSCRYMCNLIKNNNMGLDVVSGGELFTALSVGFPAEKIYFHGNNKTKDELYYAINNNIGTIVVDNIYELESINSIAGELNKTVSVFFRIKPGIDAHTHEFISTGQIDSKFGVALETGEAMDIIETAISLPNVKVAGVHCHIGSQMFDINPFVLAAEVMVNFIADVKEKLGITLEKLNLGGGFGIKYVEKDDPVDLSQYMEAVSGVVHETCSKRNINVPYILIEPGRSVVASAGITVYTVGAIKEIPGIRKYVSVDGGMCDNPRYILYQADYEAVIANKAGEPKSDIVTIAGKCCESGDILLKDKPLQNAEAGDYLAVLATGAYNYSMSSNYNRIPKPPVVVVSNGNHKCIVKRETYDDVIRNDLL